MACDLKVTKFADCFVSLFVFPWLQGCVKVWDIGQSSGKNPISTLECLVSKKPRVIENMSDQCALGTSLQSCEL